MGESEFVVVRRWDEGVVVLVEVIEMGGEVGDGNDGLGVVLVDLEVEWGLCERGN